MKRHLYTAISLLLLACVSVYEAAALLLLAFASACSVAPSDVGEVGASDVASAEVVASAGVAANDKARAPGPPAMQAPGPLDAAFSGRVIERLPAGSYCYLRVQTAKGRQHWVATMGQGEAVGAEVKVKSMGVRDSFRSNRLGRTFDRVLFGIVKVAG